MRFDAVIFDFDGTVADTSEGILESIGYALHTMGKPSLSNDAARKFIGPPLLHSFQTIAGLSEAEAQQAIELYRVNYEQNGGMFKLRFYDGFLSLAQELQQSGVRTGIASAKPDVFIGQILRHYEAASYFDCAMGISLEECCTDKSDVIRTVIRKLGVSDLSRALMVGDTLFDVQGAQNVGAAAAAVLYGFGGADELLASGAVCCADVSELRDYIFNPENGHV